MKHIVLILCLAAAQFAGASTNLLFDGDGTHAVFTPGETLRVEVLHQTPKPWNVQIRNVTTNAPVAKGDWLRLTFQFRCLEGDSSEGTLKAYIAANSPSWEQLESTGATVGDTWKTVAIAGKAKRDLGPGEYGLCLHLGAQRQTLEFRAIKLDNVGENFDPDTLPVMEVDYPGREPDAAWRKAADERIEEYRKGDLRIRVVDGGGLPVPGAKVKVEMQRHSYGFGTFLEYAGITGRSEDDKKLRDWTLKLFNRCTTPIYYADWGWANPDTRRKYLECAQWAKDHQLPTRGHCVIYPGYRFMPKAAVALTNDPPVLRKHLRDQVAETVDATRRFGFSEYDVCNELRDLTELPELLGRDVVTEWYKTARAHASTSRMAVNENTILTRGGRTEAQQQNYVGWIQYLIDAGQAPDVIGMQGHFDESLTDPETLVKILDRFAAFGAPIHITEFDINILDEQGQGDYTRDFITAVFSHPATEAITVWGFWEGRMWQPRGAMFRSDWSLKPNGQTWKNLVYRKWWTNEIVTTDRDGTCKVRGFLGDYAVTVTTPHSEKKLSLKLAREGTQSVVVLEP